MRKQILLSLTVLLVGILPSLAQDKEAAVVSCTPEENAVLNETLPLLFTAYQEIAKGMDANDPMPTVIALDSLATNYWNTIYPALPNCLEAGALGYNFGIVLDESLINTGLAQLSQYEAQYGDATLAQSLSDLVITRTDWYKIILANTFGQITKDGKLPDSMFSYELEACTAEDGESEAVTAYTDSVTAYNELAQSVGEATDENATAVLFGFAELGTNYWIKIYPELPACAEISQDGYNIGLLYNERVIVMMLSRLAAYEVQYGTTESAQTLTDGAAARSELAKSFIEAAFPNPTAEATPEAK